MVFEDSIDKIINADCLEFMSKIPDKSIDCIVCDPPYGTTAHKWDSVIPFDKQWEQYERIIKDDGIICLFGTQPFTSCLIASNLELYRYNWIWQKETPSGHLNVSYSPLKVTEDICIFSKGKVGSLSKNPIRYFPQGVIPVNKVRRNNPNSTWRKNKGYNSTGNILNSDKEYVQKYSNYPNNNILKFSRDKNTIHPTQKPVALLEYLIKTYSKEGELILDNCSGSGSTAVACHNLNRRFICIEKKYEYWKASVERLEKIRK